MIWKSQNKLEFKLKRTLEQFRDAMKKNDKVNSIWLDPIFLGMISMYHWHIIFSSILSLFQWKIHIETFFCNFEKWINNKHKHAPKTFIVKVCRNRLSQFAAIISVLELVNLNTLFMIVKRMHKRFSNKCTKDCIKSCKINTKTVNQSCSKIEYPIDLIWDVNWEYNNNIHNRKEGRKNRKKMLWVKTEMCIVF